MDGRRVVDVGGRQRGEEGDEEFRGAAGEKKDDAWLKCEMALHGECEL